MFMRPLLLRTSEVIRRSEAAGKQQSAALMQCHLILLTQDGPRDQRGRQRDSKSPPYESHSIHRLLDYLSLQTALIVWSRNVPRQPSAALQIKTDSFLPYISSHLIKTQKQYSLSHAQSILCFILYLKHNHAREPFWLMICYIGCLLCTWTNVGRTQAQLRNAVRM